MLLVTLVVGVRGYHELSRIEPAMTGLAAFQQAALLPGGMAPAEPFKGDGVVYESIYALLCGVLLIAAIGVTFAPVVHRLLHRFHLAGRADRDE
jgi:hypothetical protein